MGADSAEKQGTPGAIRAGWSALVALCSYRLVRCRVCGQADCAGALDQFGLCNRQVFGRGRRLPVEDGPAHDAQHLPGQAMLFARVR